MVALLDSKPPTPEDLDRLRAMIDEWNGKPVTIPTDTSSD